MERDGPGGKGAAGRTERDKLLAAGEPPLIDAQREFAEETGHTSAGDAIPLGSTMQPGGKVVHAWAMEGDWNPADLQSNTFEMEWPPRSGRRQSFPEIDRAESFCVSDARKRILKGRGLFIIDCLLEVLR